MPFSSTIYLFAEAILAAGTDEQKKRLLPKVASGELIGTFARSEGPGAVTPKNIRCTFKGGKLSGTKLGVPYAYQSALILVPSMIMGRFGQIRPTLAHDHETAQAVRPKAANMMSAIRSAIASSGRRISVLIR